MTWLDEETMYLVEEEDMLISYSVYDILTSEEVEWTENNKDFLMEDYYGMVCALIAKTKGWDEGIKCRKCKTWKKKGCDFCRGWD